MLDDLFLLRHSIPGVAYLVQLGLLPSANHQLYRNVCLYVSH